MSARLAVDGARRKHMFGSELDSERVFVQDRPMYRTYVRRRLTVLAGALVVVGVVSGPMARALAPTDRLDLVSSRTHVVRDGETLWSIATTLAPDRDPREVIGEIEQLNRGASPSLVAGQVLHIPSAG